MMCLAKGNITRKNLNSAIPSFWMPDFSDPAEDFKLPHVIINKFGKSGATIEEKGQFWMLIREHIKPLINCYRSNTANAMKRSVVEGMSLHFFHYNIYV
jgi:hypothetical protein